MVFDFNKKIHSNLENMTVSQIDKTIERLYLVIANVNTFKDALEKYRKMRISSRGNIEVQQENIDSIMEAAKKVEALLDKAEKDEKKLGKQLLNYKRGSNFRAEILFQKGAEKLLDKVGFTVQNNRGGCTFIAAGRTNLFIPRHVVVIHPSKKPNVVVHVRAYEDKEASHKRGEMINYDLVKSGNGNRAFYRFVEVEHMT